MNKNLNNSQFNQNNLNASSRLPSFNVEHFKSRKKQNTANIKKEKENNINVIDILKNSVIAIIVIVLLFAGITIFGNRRYVELDTLWRTFLTSADSSINSNAYYQEFNNNLIRYSNDGMTFIDVDGNLKYINSFNLKEPIFAKRGNYFAISGVADNYIYIFNEFGLIGTAETSYPIQKIKISENGIVYALLYSEDANFITVFERTGNPLDITVKTLLEGDGMPIDFDISTDGTQLAVSYGYIKNNEFSTRVVYYNFDEVGKNANNRRIVGGFDNEFFEKFVAKVNFSDNTYSQCFYDGGIVFISTRVLTSPTVINHIRFDKTIKSIAVSDKYSAVVLEDEDENILILYDKEGKKQFEKKIDFYYDSFEISKNYIIFTEADRLIIYDTKGQIRFDNDLTERAVFVGKKDTILFDDLLIGTNTYAKCVRLG